MCLGRGLSALFRMQESQGTVPRNVCYVWVFSLVLETKSITGGRASLQGVCISLCIRKRLGGFYRFNHLPVNKLKKELQTKAPLLFSLVLFLTQLYQNFSAFLQEHLMLQLQELIVSRCITLRLSSPQQLHAKYEVLEIRTYQAYQGSCCCANTLALQLKEEGTFQKHVLKMFNYEH